MSDEAYLDAIAERATQRERERIIALLEARISYLNNSLEDNEYRLRDGIILPYEWADELDIAIALIKRETDD